MHASPCWGPPRVQEPDTGHAHTADMSMADPFLPEPNAPDPAGPPAPDDELGDEIDRATGPDSDSDDGAGGGPEPVGSGGDEPVHLSQSRVTPEELTRDLHTGESGS